MLTRKRTQLPSTNCLVARPNFWPHHSARKPVQYIVLHTMAGYKAGTRATFANPNLAKKRSAHYGVNMDGSLDWYVDEDLVAYHAANWEFNQNSIGIEHEDYANAFITRSDALYETSARLVADLCKFYKIPCNKTFIIAHTDIPADNLTGTVQTTCPGSLDIDRIIGRANTILGNNTPSPTTMKATVKDQILRVRNTPNTQGIITRRLNPNEVVEVEIAVSGESVVNNNKWWKLQNSQEYIWDGGVTINAPQAVTPPTPNTPDIDPIRAGFVIQEALPRLRSTNGQNFGNAESAAREMVDQWPKYLQLIVDYKEAKSWIDKLSRLFGIS